MRGKYEETHLTMAQKKERANLPPGIGLENSPLFDLASAPWDLLTHLIRYYYVTEQLANGLIENFHPPAILSILDVGCAMGEMRTMLYSYRLPAGYARKYVGVDGDSIKLKLARTYCPSGNFIEGILPEVLTQLSTTFNGFICSEVYEHIESDKAIQTLALMRELAVQKAIAVFTIPCPSHSRYRDNPLHVNEIDPYQFIQQAEKCGWKVKNWFWLRAPNLPSLGENVPRIVQRLAHPAMHPPKKINGVDALYVLEA
jgi:hypothetical protein